jgi:formylglycine-generating enzyme required for sulfatase activity
MGLDPSLFPSDPSTVREKPNHEVWLSAYCISITEVTNNDWKQCVGEGVCSPPHEIGCSDIADYYSNDEYSNFPVVNVDWSQANEYCEWSGGRLPTEAEWEKAARGGCELQLPEVCGDEDERLFPWGSDEPVWGNCDRAAYWCSDEVSRPEPVGSHSAGISQYGVWDLAGNVWEWVSDIYSEDYYSQPIECWVDPIGPDSGSQRVIRGGSFFDIISYLRVTSRNGPEELSYSFKTGLRCVYDN